MAAASVPTVPSAARAGPFDRADVATILALLPQLATWPELSTRRGRSKAMERLRGAGQILGWLLTHRGEGWQERRVAAEADASSEWIGFVAAGYGQTEAIRRALVTDGLAGLLLKRVLLPGHGFLQNYRTSGLYRFAKQEFDAELFERVGEAGRDRGMIASQLSTAENCLVKMVFQTGRDPAELTAEDLLAYHEWGRRTADAAPLGLHAAWDLLRDVGVLSHGQSLHRTLARGQLSPAAMVDRYDIQCGPSARSSCATWKNAAPPSTTARFQAAPASCWVPSGLTSKSTIPASPPSTCRRTSPRHGNSE
ncbi:hypothetical protein OHR68_19890 [Spirillospora sp. NBC_00431]